ncbi:MAG: hypothetical protein ACRD2D_12185, partial [Terriglobales bacterium]
MELLRRLRVLFRYRHAQRDLAEEMRLHAELRGDPRRFGNELLLRETSLSIWGWEWLASFFQDVRHGLRLLARTPLVTGLALLSVTIGIGANTALFSLTNAYLLRSLPLPHPEQLVRLATRLPFGEPGPALFFSNPVWEQLRDHQRALAEIFAWANEGFELSPTQNVAGIVASGSYFTALHVQAERGHFFGSGDD